MHVSDVVLWFLFLFFGYENCFGGEDGSVPESGEAESGHADWCEWDSDYEPGKDAQLYHLCHEPASSISRSLSLCFIFSLHGCGVELFVNCFVRFLQKPMISVMLLWELCSCECLRAWGLFFNFYCLNFSLVWLWKAWELFGLGFNDVFVFVIVNGSWISITQLKKW